MKVVQVVPRLDSGGVEQGTVEVARALVTAGHEAVVISQGGRHVADLERGGVRHVAMRVADKSPMTIPSIGRLRHWLADERPDVVHPRSRLPAWLCWYALGGLPQGARPRLVTSVHGLHSVNRYSAIVARGERIEVVSNAVRDYLTGNYEVQEDRIRVIHRGIDPQRYHCGFRPSAEWQRTWEDTVEDTVDGAEKVPVVVLPGRLTRLKGHYELFAVVQALAERGREVLALIVGGAEARRSRYADEIQQHVSSTPILRERVRFLGQRDDLREIMSAADLVLSLSTTPESFGRTTLEALSLGTPVVGYDHGGVGEILSGLFAQGAVAMNGAPETTNLLAERIETILAAGKRPGMIASNHGFSLDAMCTKTLDMYAELTK